jgi:signal transduction histidine kinase
MAGNQADGGQRYEPHYSAGLRRVAMAACAILFTLVILSIVHDMPGQSPPAMAVTAVAAVVGIGGTGWHITGQPGKWIPVAVRQRATLLTLTVTGLAGIVLVGLLPTSAGYLIVFISLLALGMELPPAQASAAGLIIFAAANVVVVCAAKLSVANIISNDVGGAFLFSIGMFTRYMRVSQARAEHLLAQLQAAQAAQARNAILTERTRLAREVHDILAHSLSGLVLALDTAELLGRLGEAGPESQAKILEQVARARRIASDGLADTRRAISALRGDQLPGPALLGRLVEDTSETTGIRATLTVAGEPRSLSTEAGLALYRTAQEALVNSAKYAGRGGTAEVRLTYHANDVELVVEDARAPGVPGSGSAGLTFGGYGLTGMRERAELLGGDLTAGPTKSGFRVVLRLPAEQADRAEQATPGMVSDPRIPSTSIGEAV